MAQDTPKEEKSSAKDAPKKDKKKRLLGFPAIIANQFAPLSGNEYFKQKFGEDKYDLLIITTDETRAALIHVNHGFLEFDQVKNNKEELKPAKKAANASITTTVETLLGIMSNKINPVKAVLTFKLRLRGIKTVLQFVKYFKVLSYLSKQKAAAEKAAEAAAGVPPAEGTQIPPPASQ